MNFCEKRDTATHAILKLTTLKCGIVVIMNRSRKYRKN